MELKLSQTRGKYLYQVLCILTVAVALLPVSCNYIMAGGNVTEWVARTEAVSTTSLQSRPPAGIDFNIWYIFSGLFYRYSGNLVLTYRISMILVQLGTLFFSLLFFERVFKSDETRFAVFFGILLYMTCPYRIYVCYDLADFSAAIVWMLLPLYGWAVCGLIHEKWTWGDLCVAAFSMAGVGYADTIYFVVLMGITLLGVLCCRKALPLAATAAGMILFLPGLYRLVQYLFTDINQEWGIPVRVIMPDGYQLGQFFSTYAYRNGHPGLGLGMLICLLTGLWTWFVHGGRKLLQKEQFFIFLAVCLMIMSLRHFPWDIVQRAGEWILKLVSLLGTPVILGGLGFGCLCVPAAGVMRNTAKMENKMLAFMIPLLVLVFCIGICIYQCNVLTFTRTPLEYP